MLPNPEFQKLTAATPEDPTGEKSRQKVRELGVLGPPEMIESKEYTVPPEHLAEYEQYWSEVAEQEIEFDAEPMPITQFDLGDHVNGSLEAGEIIALGPLISASPE